MKLTIGYYIDALTVTMFCMVTLIASCVHIYALGYMHDELHDPYVDHEVIVLPAAMEVVEPPELIAAFATLAERYHLTAQTGTAPPATPPRSGLPCQQASGWPAARVPSGWSLTSLPRPALLWK